MTGSPSGATASDDAPPVATPAFRVVAGWPTDEELAALVAVLTAVSAGDAETPAPPTSRWSTPGARLGTAYGPARGGWRASGMPR